MKTYLSALRMFLCLIISPLFVTATRGVNDVDYSNVVFSNAPTSIVTLPIGNEEKFRHFIATGRACMLVMNAEWTNSLGKGYTFHEPYTIYTNFVSYQQIMDTLRDVGMIITTEAMKEPSIEKSSLFTFIFALTHKFASLSPAAFYMYPDAAKRLDQIDESYFLNWKPVFINATLRFDKLQKVVIRVERSAADFAKPVSTNKCLYLFRYELGKPKESYYHTPFLPNREYVNEHYLCLQQWYSVGKYPVRITFVADDVERTFTETGEEIKPGSILSSADLLSFTAPKGSYAVVETSQDLKNWTPISSQYQKNSLQNDGYTIRFDKPCEFFRTKIW